MRKYLMRNAEKLYDFGFKEWLEEHNLVIEGNAEITTCIYYMLILKWVEDKYDLQYNIYSHILNDWAFDVRDTSDTSPFGIYTGNVWHSITSYPSRYEAMLQLIPVLVNIITNIENKTKDNVSIDTTNKYFEPTYNLYHNNIFINNISHKTMLSIREQLSKNYVSGYSLKIPNNATHLFNVPMQDFVVNITELGEVDKWFPQYKLDDYYGYVDYGDENLAFTLKIIENQLKVSAS